jgi:hypothetical protein
MSTSTIITRSTLRSKSKPSTNQRNSFRQDKRTVQPHTNALKKETNTLNKKGHIVEQGTLDLKSNQYSTNIENKTLSNNSKWIQDIFIQTYFDCFMREANNSNRNDIIFVGPGTTAVLKN